MFKRCLFVVAGGVIALNIVGCGDGGLSEIESREDKPETTSMVDARLPKSREIRLVAHRGESYFAPENTVAAYNLAWRNNACWGVEVDVYLSKDNVLVAHHDSTTDRITKVPGKIREMTLAELRTLDAGRWKNEMWLGTKIATLQEVFSTVPSDGHIFVEIKSAGDGFAAAYETARLGSGVHNDQVSIISFSEGELKNVRRTLPHVRTLWLLGIKKDENGVFHPTAEELIGKLKEMDVTGADAHPYDLCVDAEYIKKIHDAGFEFHCWTFNNLEGALTMYDRGVDSITTDCSGKLLTEMENTIRLRAQEIQK